MHGLIEINLLLIFAGLNIILLDGLKLGSIAISSLHNDALIEFFEE